MRTADCAMALEPKLDRRGFLGVAGASIATTVITELSSARAQRDDRGLAERETRVGEREGMRL